MSGATAKLQSYWILNFNAANILTHPTLLLMMKKSLLLSLIVSLVLIFPACETDVDVNAEWEEITIVYGLLSQNDQEHYFRINKACRPYKLLHYLFRFFSFEI